MNYYAHTAVGLDGRPDLDTARWQPLSTHLRNVAARARRIGEAIVLAERVLRWKFKGGAGNPPAPVGDPPNGRLADKSPARQVTGGNGPTSCAASTTYYPDAEPEFHAGTAPRDTEKDDLPTMLRMRFEQLEPGQHAFAN